MIIEPSHTLITVDHIVPAEGLQCDNWKEECDFGLRLNWKMNIKKKSDFWSCCIFEDW
jgi:hypothetical protein